MFLFSTTVAVCAFVLGAQCHTYVQCIELFYLFLAWLNFFFRSFPSPKGLVDVAEHRDVLLAGAGVEVATDIEEPGSPIKHKRWDQVSPHYLCVYRVLPSNVSR